MDSLVKQLLSSRPSIPRILCYSFLVILAGLPWLWVGNILRNSRYFNEHLPYLIHAPEGIRVATFFALLISGLVILINILEFCDNVCKRYYTYRFKTEDWPNKWIFHGKSELGTEVNSLFIKSSRAGCLIKNYVWKDFRIIFNIRFLPNINKNLGVIFRAKNLDSYFMLEIIHTPVNFNLPNTYIKPHVRYNGTWEIMRTEEVSFLLDFFNYRNVIVEAKGQTVFTHIDNTLVHKWVLPTHVDINHVESGIQQGGAEQVALLDEWRFVKKITFRDKYGMVGFRAAPDQGAVIRDLRVEPLL